MERKSKNGGYKMNGHTLPGINQRSETPNLPDGRSSALEYSSPVKSWEALKEGAKTFWDQSRHSLTRGIKYGIHAYKQKKKEEDKKEKNT